MGMERTMIFANTKREAEYLQDRLNVNEFPCKVISGDVEQRKRMKILADFKEGKLPIMIATDVASRGIHIDGVSHVINYDLPQDCEDYVHRIGRTARAGAEGMAISLADEDGAFYIEAIEDFIKQKIPTEWAEDDMFVHDYKRSKPRPRPEPKQFGRGSKPGDKGRSGDKGKPRDRGRSGDKGKPGDKGASATGAAAVTGPESAAVTATGAGTETGAETGAKKRRSRRPRSKKGQGGEQAAEQTGAPTSDG
jgi:ATP-dependent RNA helicase RhlB